VAFGATGREPVAMPVSFPAIARGADRHDAALRRWRAASRLTSALAQASTPGVRR